jgi:hypothetical protein
MAVQNLAHDDIRAVFFDSFCGGLCDLGNFGDLLDIVVSLSGQLLEREHRGRNHMTQGIQNKPAFFRRLNRNSISCN